MMELPYHVLAARVLKLEAAIKKHRIAEAR